MRLSKIFGCILFLMLPILLGAQSNEVEADPYSITLVQSALKAHSQGVLLSWIEKRLSWCGDRVSVALLKTLSEHDLSNPETIETFLPIIRQSFSDPQGISVDLDKKPSVTLFLLKYLKQNVPDARAQQGIEETIKFVEEETRDR
jgi:hypothetical protein